MDMSVPPSPSRRWILPAAALFTLTLLSWLPYHVPSPPAISDSYVFGYNNRVAELIIALAAVLLAVFGPRLPAAQPASAQPLSTSTLRKAMTCTGVVAGVLYLFTRKLEGFGESIYLIDRVKLALEGRAAYKDFEYAYGAFFVYAPAWMTRWMHLPVADAYGIFWVLISLAGVYLLFRTINWIDSPGVNKRSIFLMFYWLTLPFLFCTGVNYSLFRYILPCFLALAVYRRLSSSAPQTPAAAVLLPVPFYAAMLLVSPELALAFAAGIIAFLAIFGKLRRGRNMLLFTVMVAGMIALTYAAERTGSLNTLHAFSSGGMNFPIMPAPHLLMLYLCIAVAACYAGDRLRALKPSALLALIFVSALGLAAALGRSDPTHVLMNPLGIMLSGSILCSGIPRLWKFFRPAMFVVFLILPLPLGLYATATSAAKAALPIFFASEPADHMTATDRWIFERMVRALGEQKATEKFNNIRGLAHLSGTIDLRRVLSVPAGTGFEVPYGFTPTRFGTFHSPLLNSGYYFEITNVTTPEGVHRKVAELAADPRRPLLLLPNADDACAPHSEADLQFIRRLFFYPYRARAVHRENLLAPLCDYIHGHYRLQNPAAPGQFGYALWKPE